MNNFFKKNLFYIFLSLIFFISFFVSFYQLSLQYDGHHHGLVYSITEDFLNNKIPYKDFLPNYGFFYILLNSFFIKIFSESISGIYFLSSILKGTGILIIGLLLSNLLNKRIAFVGVFLIFLIHPFVDTPWPDYLFLTLVLISFYLIFVFKNNYSYFFSGALYACASLTKDSWLIILLLSLLIFQLFFLYYKFYKKLKIKNFLNRFWLLGFFLPLITFATYLFLNDIFFDFLNHFNYGKLVIKNFCLSDSNNFFLRSIDCGLISFFLLLKKSMFLIFSEPYWLIFLMIIIFNILFIIKNLFLSDNNEFNSNFFILICLSLLSLLLFSNNIYHSVLTIQRFYSGTLLGLIPLFYAIDNIKNPINKFIFLSILIVFLINGFQFGRTSNNPIFPTYTNKIFNSSKDLNFLRHKKLNAVEWLQLEETKEISNFTKKKCPEIKYATNLTNDVFFRIILQENFRILNFVQFGPRNGFIEDAYNMWDKNYLENLKRLIKEQNIFIAVDNSIEHKFNFLEYNTLYKKKFIKYNNYGTKFINIYLPQKCKF